MTKNEALRSLQQVVDGKFDDNPEKAMTALALGLQSANERLDSMLDDTINDRDSPAEQRQSCHEVR